MRARRRVGIDHRAVQHAPVHLDARRRHADQHRGAEYKPVAVDELTGFIVACALIKPSKKVSEVTIHDIKKKLKQKAFAAKVNREEISQGVAMLEISEDEHYQTVLQAMQGIHEQLGL